MNINTHNQELHAIKNDCVAKPKVLIDPEARQFFSQLKAITDMKIEALNKVFA